MSKAKNKKQKQDAQSIESSAAPDKPSATDTGTGVPKRDVKNENMFRMWDARPTQIPSVPKAKSSTASYAPVVESATGSREAIDWKMFSIAATIVCILAIFSHITGLFGQFVLNDQLILTPLKIGLDNDIFWSRLFARGLATPLSGLWTNIGLANDLRSGSLIWFHMVNLCLHAMASVYLFALLFQLGRYWKFEERTDIRPEYFAVAAAGLFACHPLASEVVSYIPGREAVLVGANYLMALALFFGAFVARKPAVMIAYYAAMFVFVVMSALSGPASVTLPLAMLCIAALAKPADMSWNEFGKMRWPDLTIIGMLAAGFGYLIKMGIPTALNNGIGLISLPFPQYLASEFKAFVTYFLRCFLVPGGLSIEPPMVISNGFTDPLTILGVVAVAGIGYLAYHFRNVPQLVLGLCLTLIGLLPDFVIPQPEIVSDARFYISLAGMAIVFGWAIAKMAVPSNKQVMLAAFILFLGLAGLSNWRALAWQSEENLWREVLRTNPQSARAHAKLGFLHLLANKSPEAKKEIEEALKLDPNSPLAHLALGRVEQVEKNEQEAYKEFETALKLAKDNNASPIIVAQCQAQVADALVRQGNYSRVKELVEEAMPVLGESAQLHYLNGMYLLNNKQYILAINELQQGFIQDQRNSQYIEPIATAYLGSRLPTLIPQAYKLMERSMQTFPTKEGYLLWARAAIELNKIDEAKKYIDEAVKIGGEDAEVFYLRYFVARAQKNEEQAKAFKSKAISLDPKIETNVPVVAPENVHKYIEEQEKKARNAANPTPPTTPARAEGDAPSAVAPSNSPATTITAPSAPKDKAPGEPETTPQPTKTNGSGASPSSATPAQTPKVEAKPPI